MMYVGYNRSRCRSHVLERTPGTLRDLIAHATPEDLNWQPRPDRWSISMVLAHLADVETNGFMSRFRDILQRDNPFLPSYDQLALFQNGNTFDSHAELIDSQLRANT